jgi:hypothetical protein
MIPRLTSRPPDGFVQAQASPTAANPGRDRGAVDHEPVVAIRDARHRQHAGDRLAVQPVRLQWARSDYAGEAVAVAERLERRVLAGCVVGFPKPGHLCLTCE